MKNCKHRLYTVDRSLHLKALCSTCDLSTVIKHTWLLLVPSGQTTALGHDHRLVLLPELLATLSGDRITISMSVEQAGRTGTAGLDLLRHPQSPETFSVTPSSDGIACETRFRVSSDRRVGIEARHYTVHQGDRLIAYSPSVPFSTFLMDSGRYSSQITVRTISDEAVILATTVVHVSVAACSQQMDAAAKLREFLVHITTIGRNGEIQACLVHLHSVVPHIQVLLDPERMELVAEALRIVDTLDWPGPVQHAYMIVDMVATLVQIPNMRFEMAFVATNTLRTVVRRMVTMQLESSDARFWQTNELTQSVRQMITIFERVTQPMPEKRMTYVTDEKIPIPVEYPYVENYPEYVDVLNASLDVLDTMEALQTVVQNIEDVIAGLSRLFDREMEPMEPELRSQVGALSIISVTRESSAHKSINVSTENVTGEVWASIEQGRKSLTVCAFRTDPMWWYPTAFPVSSDVVWVYLSDQDTSEMRQSRSSPERGSFNILFRIHATKSQPTDATVIRNGHDMPVYTLNVPANADLHISFTFPTITTVLRLQIQPSARTTHYKFERSHQRISGNEIVSWSNRHDAARVLYMALMAADELDSSVLGAAEEIIDFQFSTQIRSCRSWSRTDWKTDHCRLGSQSNRTHLHCVCRRRNGAFVAQLYVAPNQLVLPRDLQLALTDNWLMLGLVAVLLFVLGWYAIYIKYIKPNADDVFMPTAAWSGRDAQTDVTHSSISSCIWSIRTR